MEAALVGAAREVFEGVCKRRQTISLHRIPKVNKASPHSFLCGIPISVSMKVFEAKESEGRHLR